MNLHSLTHAECRVSVKHTNVLLVGKKIMACMVLNLIRTCYPAERYRASLVTEALSSRGMLYLGPWRRRCVAWRLSEYIVLPSCDPRRPHGGRATPHPSRPPAPPSTPPFHRRRWAAPALGWAAPVAAELGLSPPARWWRGATRRRRWCSSAAWFRRGGGVSLVVALVAERGGGAPAWWQGLPRPGEIPVILTPTR